MKTLKNQKYKYGVHLSIGQFRRNLWKSNQQNINIYLSQYKHLRGGFLYNIDSYPYSNSHKAIITTVQILIHDWCRFSKFAIVNFLTTRHR